MTRSASLIRTLPRVLLAAALFVALTALPAQAQDMDDQPTIVEVAQQTDGFSTLVQALQAAGLVETLQGDGPFTVFAPTNDAFAALPDGQLESLLQPENRDQLRAILTYHVVSGKVMASDVTGLDEATTVQGGAIGIEVEDGSVMLGGGQDSGATVVQTDIEASNGVIHVIDAVLLPPSDMGEESGEMGDNENK
jgi:uncharacterized surface protein with fasciclin (FAS1) repeats